MRRCSSVGTRSGSRGPQSGSSGSKRYTDDLTSKAGAPEGIKELIRDSVYLLSEPSNGAPNLEVVFIHGLTDEHYHDAYWRTWTVGNNDRECWPMKFLKADFPNARILSVCYDSSLFVTGVAGMLDLYAAGVALVSALVERPVSVGQNNCPIVFVCHCLGGLLAKMIVLHANGEVHRHQPEYKNFLHNIRAFQFYSTPHQGSHLGCSESRLADFAWSIFRKPKSELAKALKVINDDVGRLNGDFDALRDCQEYHGFWVWSTVVEKNETKLECFGFRGLVVTEASARLGSNRPKVVDTDHFGVCKPESTSSYSYICLKNLIQGIVEGISQDAVKFRRGIFGITDNLLKINEMLAEHSVIGLWGMGGIGKTTLVRCWYDQEREKRSYVKFCFLENVRDFSIEACQRMLYSCLVGGVWPEGKDGHLKKMKEYIKSNKVLLVVDDVDDEKQLEALQVEGFKDGMSGSKMIVTSRDCDTLRISEKSIELPYLDAKHALKIFLYKAFSGNMELVKYKEQMETIVKKCDGLPLSLEVIASYLRDEPDIKIWKEAVVKLEAAESMRGSAEDKLWARLMISYEKLNPEHKSMFLDFASVICEMGFVTRRTLVAIWDTPSGVRNLINKSLIKWNNDDDSLTMHDQLRDMGRHIVRGNPDEPKNRSRIWEQGVKGLEIMLPDVRHQHLEGLSLHEVDNEDLIRVKESLHRKEQFIGPTHSNFEKLRLFNLHCTDRKVFDYCVKLCPEEGLNCLRLSHLFLSRQDLKKIFKKLGTLRVLQMSECSKVPYIHLPSRQETLGTLALGINWPGFMGLLPSLVMLVDTPDPLSLPDEIGELKVLRMLLLAGTWLDKLPDSVCKLTRLEELDLTDTRIGSLPDEIGKLEGLQLLLLARTHLRKLPESVCKLSLLTKLDLEACIYLQRLPKKIGDLQKLQILDLSTCTNLEISTDTQKELSRLPSFKLPRP
ncbi:hypothetical protein M758_1G332700 [Ceratodon purpureus]|nr:hypothetical protein M758_1G332700 [Ceratodon purpureus]KAG0632505.1 hypothetical protein M758_1G332700 [Ceratodon purpureus]